MTSNLTPKPDDFEVYWSQAQAELARTPPAPEIEELPLRSTSFATAYAVRLTSIGPYRIFGYLSIPKGSGPFPARYYLPRYGSVVEPIPQGAANAQREVFVTFSIGVRGQRNANQPYAASFPGMLTDGIDNHQSYVFRGVVADCCRGAEFLSTRPEVDHSRIVGIGNDLSLITAAFCHEINHVVCTPALFHDAGLLAPRSEAYPLEEINDYSRLHPTLRGAVLNTLSYFNLRWFAPRVAARTLVMGEADGAVLDGKALANLMEALPGNPDFHPSERSTYKDGLFAEEWISQQFGLAQTVLPEQWR